MKGRIGGFGRGIVHGMVGATIVLLAGAVLVRGMRPSRPLPVEEQEAAVSVREPLQLLQSGAHTRVEELDDFFDEESVQDWTGQRQLIYALEGCPRLLGWMQTAEGLALERHLGELRKGGPEHSLAALALLFELARRTDWEPGFMGGAADAEKLGELLADWLRVRAEESVRDPVLREPALAAVALYGRVMRTAYQAPVIGRNDSAYERARSFMTNSTGIPDGVRNAFGRELQARFPRAVALLSGDDDAMRGLAEEARVLFPELDGACEE